jgi:uroporphyrinogen-III synthase
MSFAGLRVLSLESRRSEEIAHLIANQQGDPFVAPAIREAPLENNQEAFAFAERLFAGEFEMMILLTGVGTRALDRVLAARYPPEAFAGALRNLTVVARGPKPSAVLREMRVPIAVQVPEPNTWRELIAALDGRPERRIAIQEYGKRNDELLAALVERGAEVTAVRVYQYDLPEDTAPLAEAVRRLAGSAFDVAMFTTSAQVVHLFRMAEELGLAESVRSGLARAMVASIGPTTSEALEVYGIVPDMSPSHPKMGFLVKEAAEQAPSVVARKSQ